MTPNPTGALATAAGPSLGAAPVPFQLVTSSTSITQGVVTVTATATGAPAIPFTYYCVVTYTATGTESLVSVPFVINAPAGLLPIVSVSATGEPTGATNFALYAGVYYGAYALQQATRTTTATGATFTLAYPLTNSNGVNQAPSNVTTNIVGIALGDSGSVYALGIGGSAAAGGYNQTLGIWANPPALGSSPEVQYGYVASLVGATFEISLKQAWYPNLIGASIGITLDAASGWHIADTTATQCGIINGKVTGAGQYSSYDEVGGYGEAGARVICLLTTAGAAI